MVHKEGDSIVSTTSVYTLKELLNQAFPGDKVNEYKVKAGVGAGENVAAVLTAIEVDLTRGKSGKSQTINLFLKTYPKNEARVQLLEVTGMFSREIHMYRYFEEIVKFQKNVLRLEKDKVIVPAFPKVYSSHLATPDEIENNQGALEGVISHDENEDICLIRGHILMEDLRVPHGFRSPNRHVGTDLEESKLFITELAREHGISFAHKKIMTLGEDIFSRYPFLVETTNLPHFAPALQHITNGAFEVAFGLVSTVHGPDSKYTQRLASIRGSVLRIIHNFYAGRNDLTLQEMIDGGDIPEPNLHDLDYERKVKNQWLVVVHGDPHLGNLLYNYRRDGNPKEVKVVDLQCARDLCIMSDLVYFFFSSTTRELRAKHLRTLFELYHEEFTKVVDSLGERPWPNFTVEAMMERYRKWQVFGLATSIMIFPLLVGDTNIEDTAGSGDGNIFEAAMNASSLKGNKGMLRLVEVIEELVDNNIL